MKARLEVKLSAGEGACAKKVKETEYRVKRKGNESCPSLLKYPMSTLNWNDIPL